MEDYISTSNCIDTANDEIITEESFQSIQESDKMVEIDHNELRYCLNPVNSASTISRYPDLTVSDCESTSIIITSEVNSEVQTAAQMFVDDLISRAQKEADKKMSANPQVILIECS